ncbi:MAG: FAD-dependent thymidylate synthase [Chitinophagales bacterium]|nr:FAD-dependent thymidylate synthase [Chitinophagales bacterium]
MEKNKVNKVELVYITPNAAQKIESIACVCYDSEPTDDCKIFKGCMKSGHLSVAEHSDITFKVTCSRACSHQLVRHRTNKYTQRSQRYCTENNFEYYIPDSIKNDETALKIYKMAMGAIKSCYKQLTDIDVPAEDARYVLPNACETIIYITMDFRNFFHFLNERLCTRAQKEIRDIAKEMARLAVEACPIIKPYCVPKCESFSIAYCPEHKGCGRHKPLKEIVRDEYK